MSVYFIQAEDGGPIKIGWAKDPDKRLRLLQCGHPDVLVLRRVVAGGTETETELHGRFWQHHLRGEWFHPHPELAKFGRCKATDPDKVERANEEQRRLERMDAVPDLMVKLMRTKGILSIPELLHFAIVANQSPIDQMPGLIEPMLEAKIAFLEQYGLSIDQEWKIAACQSLLNRRRSA